MLGDGSLHITNGAGRYLQRRYGTAHQQVDVAGVDTFTVGPRRLLVDLGDDQPSRLHKRHQVLGGNAEADAVRPFGHLQQQHIHRRQCPCQVGVVARQDAQLLFPRQSAVATRAGIGLKLNLRSVSRIDG
ncbi:hypothetical protein D9M70_497810 [compost metagenome]